MKNNYRQTPCLKISLEKAYLMGLESALVVLEKSVGLAPEGQKKMLESLKKMVQKEKEHSSR